MLRPASIEGRVRRDRPRARYAGPPAYLSAPAWWTRSENRRGCVGEADAVVQITFDRSRPTVFARGQRHRQELRPGHDFSRLGHLDWDTVLGVTPTWGAVLCRECPSRHLAPSNPLIVGETATRWCAVRAVTPASQAALKRLARRSGLACALDERRGGPDPRGRRSRHSPALNARRCGRPTTRRDRRCPLSETTCSGRTPTGCGGDDRRVNEQPGDEHDDIEPVFRLERREEDDGPVLVIAGDLDMAAVEPLSDAIAALPSDRPIVLDLTDVTFLDSTGLTVIVRAHRARDSRRDAVVLRHPRPGVLWVLETSGIANIVRLELADT